MSVRRIPAAVVLVVVALFATVTGVSGHARVKESTPTAGEVLETSPAEVRITFSTEIQKIAGTYGIEVTDEAGASFTSGPPVVDESRRSLLSVPLAPGLQPGRYIVKYKNVSDTDGDPFEGGFAFYVGVQPTAEQLAADKLLGPAEEPTATIAAPVTTPAVDRITPTGSPRPASNGSEDDSGRRLASVVFVAAAVVVIGIVAAVVWMSARRRAS